MDGGSAPRFGSAVVERAVLLARADALLARAIGRSLAPWDLNWPQALSLLVLERQQEPISATRLVEQLGLGRTAMTSVVDRLERRGWVERRPSPRDRRMALLVLTPAGRSLVVEINPVLALAIEHFLDGASADSLAAWVGGLDQLISATRAALPEGGGA